MSVRPVDSLTMVPRLNEAGRLVHNAEQHPFSLQHALSEQMREQVERARSQVKAKAKAEQAAIGREQGRGGTGTGKGRSEGRRPEPPKPSQTKAHQSGRLDVKV